MTGLILLSQIFVTGKPENSLNEITSENRSFLGIFVNHVKLHNNNMITLKK